MGIFVKAPSVEVTKEISFIKDNGLLDGILSKENIPVPSSSDMGLTDSTIVPFSDKLNMKKT